jgi:uncharacterized protein YodC (DUF2158 family)
MATKFAKGQNVQVKSVIPAGPVQKLRMDEDGNFFYLVQWPDAEGVATERWFSEDELELI